MEVTAKTDTGEQVLEGRSVALGLLTVIRAFSRLMDRVYIGTGYLCGTLLLLLGLFITYQVIARKLGIITAQGTDQMSGYILVMAATWAFSYALRTGSHVRIDVLLPHMPPWLRALADWVALGSIAFFASIVAWQTWLMVLDSYDIEAYSITYPRTPLWVPQSVLGIGFSLLGLTAIQMMLSMVAEGFLPRLHQFMGGTVRPQALPTDGPGTAVERRALAEVGAGTDSRSKAGE
ncbi:MAG TPA: TRAP transporter small permease [Dehalococcoidia bacterium]|nr:TRAP transporter small permease [Dehalococcoidia bacterium]